LNECPARAPEVEEARVALADLALPLCPVGLSQRRIFGRATASGRSVLEIEPNGAAAKEVAALWNYVRKALS
jgi:chromosome partitioning protein